MITEMNLSKEEMELVAKLREEKEARAKAEMEEVLNGIESNREKILKRIEERIRKYNRYFEKITEDYIPVVDSSKFELLVDERHDKKYLTYTVPGTTEEVTEEFPYSYKYASIVLKEDPTYFVYIEEAYTSYSSWRSTKEDYYFISRAEGIDYKVSERKYKKVGSALNRMTEERTNYLAGVRARNFAEVIHQEAMTYIKNKYGEDNVGTDTKWTKYSGSVKVITVTLENGTYIELSVNTHNYNEDKPIQERISVYNITYPRTEGTWEERIEKISNINFN